VTEQFNNHQSGASRFVTIPNILSLSRLVLLPVVLLLLFRRQGIAAVAVMAVSWVTDALDGWFARRLNQVSNLGRVLDHLVDKVWIGTVLVCLVYLSDLPLAIAAAVILRDLIILSGSAVIMRSRGTFVSSDVVGKTAGCAFALMILFYTLKLPALMHYTTAVNYTVGVLVVVSLVNYTALFLRKMAHFRLPGEDAR
jgi:CDP-diacylglycerol--glycerol-3-phosphate 3-phosphatidyltransferase